MSKNFIIIMGSALLLSGCVSSKPVAPQPSMEGPNVVLAEAAVSVSRSLNELAAIEKSATPGQKILCNPSPRDMPGLVSVDWSGPIEPLLARIASISGYRLHVFGPRPAVPAIITMTAKNLPVVTVLRDIDYQVDKKAYIQVYPRKRIVELKYMRP